MPTECIIITGASSGIGRAVSVQLAKEKERSLVLVARKRLELDKVV